MPNQTAGGGLDATDQAARDLAESGDLAEAARTLIREHGPGVLGFLQAIAPSADVGEDLYGTVCERLWLNLQNLRWAHSPRTWMYAVARNLVRDIHRHPRGPVPLSQIEELQAVVASTTAEYRRTEAKSKLARLREALDPDDRTLLILRVDREMPWLDIAMVLAESDETNNQTLEQIAAKARKRFQRIKLRLRDAWSEGRSP